MNSILPDNPFQSTCCVCGDPVGVLGGILNPLGGGPSTCKTCGNSVCHKHYSVSKKMCVKCSEGRDSWCKTPTLPPLPPPKP
ncbi:MAG TPA: hypothetical protein V6C69_21295 [Trichormus sp.]